MSTNFRDVNRTVSAGDLVISVAEIFDRLQTKVDAATLEQLLRDILAGRRDRVRPGELITAELINQMLAELESLEERVTRLEAGVTTPSEAAVIITRLIPPEGQAIRVGQELQVIGQNFGFSRGRHEAFIDDFRVLTFKDGSSDTALIFNIPLQITNVPTTGRPATLTVSNQTSQAQKTISLLPVAQTGQGANVDVLFETLDPTTIRSGEPVTFRYSVRSRGNQAQVLTMRAQVSEVANATAWQDQIQILNDDLTPNTLRTISLPAGGQVFVRIRIPIVPTVPTGTTFRLTVDALFPTGGVSGSLAKPYTVAVITPPEDRDAIPTLTFSHADPPNAVQGNTIQIRTGVAEVVVSLLAEFAIAPATYNVLDPVVTGAGWRVVRFADETPAAYNITPSDLSGLPPKTSRLPSFLVTSTGGSATGEVTFIIQRQGQTISRTCPMTLARV